MCDNITFKCDNKDCMHEEKIKSESGPFYCVCGQKLSKCFAEVVKDGFTISCFVSNTLEANDDLFRKIELCVIDNTGKVKSFTANNKDELEVIVKELLSYIPMVGKIISMLIIKSKIVDILSK